MEPVMPTPWITITETIKNGKSFSQDMDGRIFKTLLQEGFWIQTVKETFTHFQQMEEIIRNGELKA